MRCRHTTACAECPWRKESPAGWLGGWSPEFYTDAVQNNEVPACHLSDFGPDDDRTSMRVGKRDDTFQHPALFYRHHAGQEYVHPLMRKKTA